MTADASAALEAALEPYAHVPVIAAGVRAALGATPTVPLAAGSGRVVAFLVRPGDQLFQVFALAPAAFVVFEVAANGDTLTVAVPLTRLRRVAETRIGPTLTLTVELDADVARLSTDLTITGGPAYDPNGQPADGQRAGRAQALTLVRPAVYEISCPRDGGDADALAALGLALRAALAARPQP